MTSYASTLPAAVAAYIDRYTARDTVPTDSRDYRHVATIVETYTPGTGWQRFGMRKGITPSYARKLRAAGVTAVSVDMGGNRRADFQIGELLPRRTDRRRR